MVIFRCYIWNSEVFCKGNHEVFFLSLGLHGIKQPQNDKILVQKMPPKTVLNLELDFWNYALLGVQWDLKHPQTGPKITIKNFFGSWRVYPILQSLMNHFLFSYIFVNDLLIYYLFIYLFIHLFICLFIYLVIWLLKKCMFLIFLLLRQEDKNGMTASRLNYELYFLYNSKAYLN